MMVVGVSPLHDHSIAVVLDGKLIYSGEIERISRYKHNVYRRVFSMSMAHGVLVPQYQINSALIDYIITFKTVDHYLLRKHGVRLRDADAIAVAFDRQMVRFVPKSLKSVRHVSTLPPSNSPYAVFASEMLKRWMEEGDTRPISEISRVARGHACSSFALRDERGVVLALLYLNSYVDWRLKLVRRIFMSKYLLGIAKEFVRNMVIKALKKGLGRYGITVADIELLLEAFEDEARQLREIRKVKKKINSINAYEWLNSYIKVVDIHRVEPIIKAWKYVFGTMPKVIRVPHHLAHVASAYYTSGMNKAVGIAVDGSGEWEATSVWTVEKGEFELIRSFDKVKYSLGIFYEEMAKILGYDIYEGPAKVMGLAPYGTLKNNKYYNMLKDVLRIFGENSEKPYELGIPSHELYQHVKNKVGEIKWDKNGKPLNQEASDFARAVQRRFEEAYLTLMKWARERSGIKNAVVVGGAALNAKANMEVIYANIFNDVFFFPAANDAGTAIGAAFWAYEHVLGGRVDNKRIESVFWGMEYTG